MENSNKFDLNSFAFPDVCYAPVYIWVWNETCTREIIDEQLGEMQRLGIRAFYILPEPKEFRPDSMPTKLSPAYLSEEYFELCAYAIKKGKSLGMLCWIYDEGGWPSGGACGRVMKDRPEFARQVLKCYEHTFSAGQTFKRSSSDVVAAFLNDGEIIEDGYDFTEDTVVTEYVSEKEKGNYPDLLNKNATEYFIEITHKKYSEALKNEFSEAVTAVFTDEPKAPFMPFSQELADKYEETYGESIISYLPVIAKRTAVTEENVYILHRWYDLCSRMFCENFLLPCKKWANQNGIAFTGHLDKDHSPHGCMNGGGNFNLMRALRCFDIPGIDVIWRQLYPDDMSKIRNDMNAYNGFYPRYASSAAAQNGTKRAMSEIFGVAGPGLTYDIMRFTVGYQAVRGINIFNPFNFPLGRKGQLLAQELPIFTENQPYYRHFGQFNRYAERLSYISSLGERVCETALYYPVSDFQGGLTADAVSEEFDSLGRRLEDMAVDFDIVDDDVIQNAEITDNGGMHIGKARYRSIILPESAYIPEATKAALERFVSCGGTVIYEPSTLEPTVHIEGDGLRAMHRKAENAEIFCLFRETGEKGDYTISLPSSEGYLLDPESGRLQCLKIENNELKLSLEIGETAIVLLTDEVFSAKKAKNLTERNDIKDNFKLSKETELICTENGFENIEYSDEAVPVSLGDWSYLIGSAYSGSCIYETAFKLSEDRVGKEGKISLGRVRFTASVYLNERYLGTALMPPYTLEIPSGLLAKENNLKIVVTNTTANWYLHTDYFDKWSAKELSPYFETELDYAKDSVSGGLFGPVALYTE